jgi:hypothetical protein
MDRQRALGGMNPKHLTALVDFGRQRALRSVVSLSLTIFCNR